MNRIPPALPVLLALWLGSSQASAQEAAPLPQLPPVPGGAPAAPGAAPGQVVVTMHDDSRARGTVVEVTQGGQPAVITVVPWRPLEPEMLPPGAPVPPPPRVSASPVRGVIVHMNAEAGVVLEAVPPGETNWRQVCQAPCDAELAVDSLYRVAGGDLQPSKSFQLGADVGGHVSLDVHPVTKGSHEFAEGLLIGGGVALSASAVLLYVDLLDALSTASCYDGGTCGGHAGLAWTGLGLAVAGATGLIVGAVSMQPTSVVQSMGYSSPVAPGAAGIVTGAQRDDSWRRLPTWHEASAADSVIPRDLSVPVFSARF